MFLLEDKYKLELKWKKVRYEDGVCYLKSAYFSGPVLKYAEKIEANNSIDLDFYKHYFIIVENVYIGKLSWGKVDYINDKVFLSDCRLTHKSEINKVPKLLDNDILVIDCKLHEREIHGFYPNYNTYVLNENTQVYEYAS